MEVVTFLPCQITSRGSPTFTETIFIQQLAKSHSSTHHYRASEEIDLGLCGVIRKRTIGETGRQSPAAESLLLGLGRFFLVGFAGNFLEALLQRGLGEKIRCEVRVVHAGIVEGLEDSSSVSRTGHLQGGLDTIESVIVRVGSLFFRALSADLVARDYLDPNHKLL